MAYYEHLPIHKKAMETTVYFETPRSRCIKLLQVTSGFNVADNEIVKRVSVGDLVITGDVPLAAEVVEKGGYALNPRGEPYSDETISGPV